MSSLDNVSNLSCFESEIFFVCEVIMYRLRSLAGPADIVMLYIARIEAFTQVLSPKLLNGFQRDLTTSVNNNSYRMCPT
jgi:hypothetical protein